MTSKLTLSEYSKSISSSVVAVSEGDTILKGVVSGNQASDMDSIICALTLAYLLTITNCEENETYVPLVACNRDDADLRQETVVALKMAGVEMKDLVFGDDEHVPMLFEKAGELVLTDHCAVDEFSKQGKDKVSRIVDHHKDLKAHLDVTGWARNIAHGYVGDEKKYKLVGSCGTAVAEVFMNDPNGISLMSRDNGAVAILLNSVILIDTANLSADIGKATNRDIAWQNVTSHFAKGLPSQNDWYKQLQDAKFDIDFWRSTTAEQILRYDFKAFSSTDGKLTVGISSINCSIDDFVAKDGWQDVLSNRTEAGGYHFYIVLTNVITNEGTKRQKLFFSDKERLVAEASTYFRNSTNPYYQLEGPLEIPGDPVNIIAFNQLNVEHSRKKVAPSAIQYLDSIEEYVYTD